MRSWCVCYMDVVGLVKSVVTLSGLPRLLQVGIYSLVGIAVGGAILLVRIANATSYLSDDLLTCINCHVMTDAYASWQRGSHGRVAAIPPSFLDLVDKAIRMDTVPVPMHKA